MEKLSKDKALALHKAPGHLYVPGVNVECQDCLATKGGRTGHSNQRDPNLNPGLPLQQLNLDLYGELEPSYDNNVFCVVITCDISKFVWVLPIKSKDSVVELAPSVASNSASPPVPPAPPKAWSVCHSRISSPDFFEMYFKEF